MILRNRFARLSAILWLLLSCLCCSVNAQVTLYDNLDPLRDPDPEAGRWRAWPEHTSEWTVQPFLTGDSDNVSSVTIDFQPKGNPTGDLAIEIWDDNGSGKPGNVVGVVGSLDLASLDGEGGEWEFITFDNPVVGLSPDSAYYVVVNFTDTDIDRNNWVANGFTGSDEGTFGAGWTRGGPGENWQPLRSILNNSNFSYLDMAVSAKAGQLPGDFDQDGTLTANDIDLLGAAIRDSSDDLSFDVNTDSEVSTDDHGHWVHASNIANTYFGDSNLDGEFNSGDLTEVFKANEYEDSITLNSTWAEGDWNGDGDFDSGDLVAAFKDGGYEKGPRAAVVAIPEPSSWILLTLGLVGIGRFRKR